MKHLKTFENFNDALYDIMSLDDDDKRKVKLSRLIKGVERKDSEKGVNWSDNEIEKIKSELKNMAPKSYNYRVDQDVKSKNELEISKNSAKTVIRKCEEILDDDKYVPRNPDKVKEIKNNISLLKSAISKSDKDSIKELENKLNQSLLQADFRFSNTFFK